MGLNRFLPAFGSMYPAVMYTTGPRRRVVEGRIEARHDAYPIALGAGVAVLLGGWF